MDTVFGKMLPPPKKCPSIYLIIFLLKNQASPSLPSQVTFLTHITIFPQIPFIIVQKKLKIKKKLILRVHPRFHSNILCSQYKINLTLDFFGLRVASETVVHIHTLMFHHMHSVCNCVVLKYFTGFPLYLNFWWVSLKNLH